MPFSAFLEQVSVITGFIKRDPFLSNVDKQIQQCSLFAPDVAKKVKQLPL